MKNTVNRSGPQSLRLCAAAFAVIITLSLNGCGEGLDVNYFEFDSASGTITGYSSDGPRNVTLPSSIDGVRVTAVGKNAFRGKQLTGVSIFTGVITIGEGAFADNQLTGLTMLDSVTIIGVSAFENNPLETLVLPNSIVTIREKAFKNNRLTNLIIGSKVVYIEEGAFAENKLTGITIPDSVDNIEKDAFSGNPLTSVTIGQNKNYASNIVPNFGTVYNNNGKQAGTYTQLDSAAWIKQ
jgi:hypothetical protein